MQLAQPQILASPFHEVAIFGPSVLLTLALPVAVCLPFSATVLAPRLRQRPRILCCSCPYPPLLKFMYPLLAAACPAYSGVHL